MNRDAGETDMDIQTTIAEAIIAELKRQAEVSEHGLTVEAGEPGFVTPSTAGSTSTNSSW